MTQSTVAMPQAVAYQTALSRELGQAQVQDSIQRAEVLYAELYPHRTHYDNRALRQHLEQNILPGVALYKTLLEDDDMRERALDLMGSALQEASIPGRQQMERLGRLPFYYTLMRLVVKPMMHFNFPEIGWRREWLETSGETIAFNMDSCFYLDVLESYGVPELTAHYCASDDFVYDNVSPQVKWARTKTLGRGDDCCDFRFERVRKGS